jgi:hypothetical protein
MPSLNLEDIENRVADITRGISCTLTNISTANERKSNEQSLKFTGNSIPSISVAAFYLRLQNYFQCSPVVYIGALIYIDRFIVQSNVILNYFTVHRLMLVGFTVAVKYFEDEHYSNLYYAQVGGIELEELNKLETFMLISLDFDLHICKAEFNKYLSEVIVHSQICSICREEDNSAVVSIKKDAILPDKAVISSSVVVPNRTVLSTVVRPEKKTVPKRPIILKRSRQTETTLELVKLGISRSLECQRIKVWR